MHARAIEVREPGLAYLGLTVHEVERSSQELLVYCLHTFLGERTGVLDLPVGKRVNHAARPEAFAKFGTLWVVGIFWLLLGVQMIEVTEELVETVIGR